MPIYAYRCEACGFAKEVLQKMSDDALIVCSSCNQPSFKKQLTAAGFQLKGSGWYVTDFRGNPNSTTNGPEAGATETDLPATQAVDASVIAESTTPVSAAATAPAASSTASGTPGAAS